jgi:CheY-like chemotaxis protein
VTAQQKQVLLIGDYQHGDFRDAVRWLAENTLLTPTSSTASALSWIEQGHLPDVIIIAQSRPGQLSRQHIERLHAASPISRLVALLGSWCEGEGRSGRPWPGVVRIYWHQWRPRMIPELSASGWPAHSLWQLPRTSTPSEQYKQAARVDWPQHGGLVAIHTRIFRTYEALSDACRQGGYATVWFPPAKPSHSGGLAAAIWDGDGWDACDIRLLEQTVQQHQPAPVLAMLDVVRRNDHDQALAAGAFSAIAKPFLVNDLLWQLGAALSEFGHLPAVSSVA